MRVLVTGATGNTGRSLVENLAARGVATLSATRSGEAVAGATGVEFDWLRSETHQAALRDVDRAYLVPPADHPDPAEVMLPFLRDAADAGVMRVTLLSSSALAEGGPRGGEGSRRVGSVVPAVGGAAAVVVHAESHWPAPVG